MYENREYLIIPATEVSKVDFGQVCETSAETLRFSVSGEKTFVKWNGDAPAFVAEIVGAEGPYNHSEILEILSGEEWTKPNDESMTPTIQIGEPT
jgi:hypothetical protein